MCTIIECHAWIELIGIFGVDGFSEFIQRIFEHGEIKNNYLAPDKQLNAYGTPSFVIIQAL